MNENIYNNLSHVIKNRLGLPYTYFDLSIDQKDFIDTLLDSKSFEHKEEVIKRLGIIYAQIDLLEELVS